MRAKRSDMLCAGDALLWRGAMRGAGLPSSRRSTRPIVTLSLAAWVACAACGRDDVIRRPRGPEPPDGGDGGADQGDGAAGQVEAGAGDADASGAGPPACGSFVLGQGGVFTSGTLHGFAYTGVNTGSTISPADLSPLPAGGPLCVSGSVSVAQSSPAYAILGLFVNSVVLADLTDAGRATHVIDTTIPTSDGVDVSVTNRAGSPLLLCLAGTNSGPDGAHKQWCIDYAFVGQTFLPWTSFRDNFGAGNPYDRQPIESINVVVPTPVGIAPTAFDFCLDGLVEAATFCGCVGSGCPCPAGRTACQATCVDTSLDDDHCGACDQGCSTLSACAGGRCLAPLAPARSEVPGVAIDGANLYWTERGTEANGFTDGSVLEMPLGGGIPTTLASSLSSPYGLVVDRANVYFTNEGSPASNFTDGSVMKVPIGGGSAVTLAPGLSLPSRLAVDATTVYWAEEGTGANNFMDGRIMKVAIEGGSPVVLATGQIDPLHIVVDGAAVYWTNLGSQAANYVDGALMKVALGGGSPVVLASAQQGAFGMAIDGTNLYWTNAIGSTVMSLPPAGAAPVPLASNRSYPCEIAVHAGNVYWTDNVGGTLVKVPIGGGTPATLAAGQNYPWALAVDDTSVYFSVVDGTGAGGILRVAR
jgi:hypothetical protein